MSSGEPFRPQWPEPESIATTDVAVDRQGMASQSQLSVSVIFGLICSTSGAIVGFLFAGEIRLALGTFVAVPFGAVLGWFVRGIVS